MIDDNNYPSCKVRKMNRIKSVEKSIFEAAKSSTDANRLYSILLDTRASSVSENMYDITEKLMKNEKENSKIALEQLWALKKNLCNEGDSDNGTIDLLINYYQEKLNVLRNKEEKIKKISRDSRELLEEKRQRDSEIASVKQEISDCSMEIERLNEKMKELKIKEQELTLIEHQVQKELEGNTNEVVNGLYEIILSTQESQDQVIPPNENYLDNTAEIDRPKNTPFQLNNTNKKDENNKNALILSENNQPATPDTINNHSYSKIKSPIITKSSDPKKRKDCFSFDNENKENEIFIPFPRSVVKTTRGTIIGEYFYDSDPKVSKDKRHYIFSSIFFRKYLGISLMKLTKYFDSTQYSETRHMIQDAYKRISENNNLHFEISTNEILNIKVLRELWQKMVNKEFKEVLIICNRLNAKINALGKNYITMLEEQMARYREG